METTPTGRATLLPLPTFVARRKAALSAVVAQLNTSPLKPASFEPFTVAPERQFWSSLHNPQIRSTCVGEIEGAEFRTFFGLGNAGPVRRTSIVNHVLDDAQAFVSAARAGRLDAPLRTAEKLAERINDEAARRSCTMHVKAIGLYPGPFTNEVLLSLDIEMLGDDLRPSIDNITGWDSELDRLRVKIDQTVDRGARLSQRRAELKAEGASCWIDETALRIAIAAGPTIAEVIDMLVDRDELQLRYESDGSPPLPCSIRWKAGVLQGRVGCPADRWQCSSELLTVKNLTLPDTLTSAMTGRRLGAVIEHPLIPADAVVTGWQDLGGWVSIPLRMAFTRVIDGEVARRTDGSIEWRNETEQVSRRTVCYQ